MLLKDGEKASDPTYTYWSTNKPPKTSKPTGLTARSISDTSLGKKLTAYANTWANISQI